MRLDRQAGPGLLVSVRDTAEAREACAGGADWIDLKEPTAGALGPVDLATAHEVAGEFGDQIPLSAALGELEQWTAGASTGLLNVPHIGYVKLGLAGLGRQAGWSSLWREADQQVAASGKKLVAVAYADWQQVDAPLPEEVIQVAERSSAQCLLIDTCDKQSSGTLQQWGTGELVRIVSHARQRRLSVVLAGKLQSEELAELPLHAIDLVAVRGAVCRGNRAGFVDHRLVSQFKQQTLHCCRAANC